MAGIVFFGTEDLKKTEKFYTERIGMKLWHDQGKCVILRHENMLLGFCGGKKETESTCITFFFTSRDEVDIMYRELKDISTSEPKLNEKFNIYHFWAKDPEERTLEFQYFLDDHLKI